MSLNMKKELAALEQMTVGQLQERYIEVFGEPVRSRHKQYLIRRIAWRLQANAEGGLSERALRRAEELAIVADVDLKDIRCARLQAERYSRTGRGAKDVQTTLDDAGRVGGTVRIRRKVGAAETSLEAVDVVQVDVQVESEVRVLAKRRDFGRNARASAARDHHLEVIEIRVPIAIEVAWRCGRAADLIHGDSGYGIRTHVRRVADAVAVVVVVVVVATENRRHRRIVRGRGECGSYVGNCRAWVRVGGVFSGDDTARHDRIDRQPHYHAGDRSGSTIHQSASL